MMMAAEQLAEETQRLGPLLLEVQDKIADQWLGEDLQTYLSEQKAKHEEAMARSREEMDKLKNSLDQLKGQAKNNEKAMQERVETLRAMRTELDAEEQETDAVLREKEVAKGLLSKTQQDIEKDKELLTAQEKATQLRLVELEKSADWFKDRLALRFKKTTGDRLQVIFTCIDPDPTKQDRPFFFSVRISEGKYIDCDPKVPDMDDLVEKLNATNNFRSFIIMVRQKFKALAIAKSSF